MKLIFVGILLLILLVSTLFIRTEVKGELREEQGEHTISISLFVFINSLRVFCYEKIHREHDSNFSLMEYLLLELWESRQPDKPKKEGALLHQVTHFFPSFPRYYLMFMDLTHLLSLGLHYVIIEQLKWKSRTGSSNAMVTALSSGVLWTVKGSLLGPLSSKCKLQKVQLDVSCDFTNPVFFSSFSCILKIRIVHIIIIASYAIALKVRWWINGFPARKTEPSH